MIPLLSLAYLPPVAWCSVAWQADQVALEACDHYQKGSLRNRCYIAGPNGIQRLSIPLVKGKNQQTPIRDVRISYDEAWQRLHWRSIRTAYGNAPFFEHYADQLSRFYEKPYSFLFDYNLDFLEFILQEKLGWKGRFTLTGEYRTPGDPQEETDFRNAFAADGNDHPSWFEPRRYAQVFMEKSGFIPNLSVLDLLFCCGKQAVDVLNKAI
jgi:hypothetical protein